MIPQGRAGTHPTRRSVLSKVRGIRLDLDTQLLLCFRSTSGSDFLGLMTALKLVRMAVTAVSMVIRTTARPIVLHQVLLHSRLPVAALGLYDLWQRMLIYVVAISSSITPIQWPMRLCVFDWMEESIGWIVASLR